MTLHNGNNLLITRRRALALGAAAGGLTLAPTLVPAATITINPSGNFQPMPIAIPKFIGGGDGETAATAAMSQAASRR